MGKSEAALATDRSLLFTGKGSMPRSFAGEPDVAAYVSTSVDWSSWRGEEACMGEVIGF